MWNILKRLPREYANEYAFRFFKNFGRVLAMDAPSLQANKSAQAEEMEALGYIYGEDFIPRQDEHSCEISVYPADEAPLAVKVRIFFPDGYPSDCEPLFEAAATWLSDQHLEKLSLGFHDLYMESPGDVIVFKWIEWMKEQSWLWEDGRKLVGVNISKNIEAESKSEHVVPLPTFQPLEKLEDPSISADQNLEALDNLLGIVHGSPVTEKRSTFQAHLAPVHSVDQVETVMDALQRNRKIAGATHNIMAYRIVVPDKNTVLQDYDDDGETAAGGRLLHLLQILDATDVVVVVSRWFGGILLGPDRFKHINNAARALLETSGYIKDSHRRSATGGSSSKKGAGKGR